MRLSHLEGKEIVNLSDGTRLGVIDDCELIFEPQSGAIRALVLPDRSRFLRVFSAKAVTVPWQTIRQIGDDIIIVDFNPLHDEAYVKFTS